MKTMTLEVIKTLAPTTIANVKQNITPKQINLKPYTKGLLLQF